MSPKVVANRSFGRGVLALAGGFSYACGLSIFYHSVKDSSKNTWDYLYINNKTYGQTCYYLIGSLFGLILLMLARLSHRFVLSIPIGLMIAFYQVILWQPEYNQIVQPILYYLVTPALYISLTYTILRYFKPKWYVTIISTIFAFENLLAIVVEAARDYIVSHGVK